MSEFNGGILIWVPHSTTETVHESVASDHKLREEETANLQVILPPIRETILDFLINLCTAH